MSSSDNRRVGLVIPTLNAGARWPDCLAALASQSLTIERRLVVDSSSTDLTFAQAEAAGFEVIRIERSQFNHGGTRQWAAEYLSDCEIIVFLTQDAILAAPDALVELVRCFDDPGVAVAYGRQLPHAGAAPIEAHARAFNYGPSTNRKDALAALGLGTRVFFCSNSFAAYRRSTLFELGGFRADLILGEDAEFAARAISSGYANVYCATSLVYHSHDYNVSQIFRRYFDTGVFHAHNLWMYEKFGSHAAEGRRFVKSELKYLARLAPWQLPRSLCHTIAKIVGYRLGRMERVLSTPLKRWLSMTPGYWRTKPREG